MAEAKKYIISALKHRTGEVQKTEPLTLPELIKHYSYTLECGASYSHEKGNKKINRNPATIKTLIVNLINAVNNSAANGYAGVDYTYLPA